MKKSNLCFIGAGFHATTNIYPAAIEAGVTIKAIATRNAAGAKNALVRFGSAGNPYDDYLKMIDNEDCDGVVIVAQPEDQYKLALSCVKKGKNVYADKPLGWNEEEAAYLHSEAVRNNAKVMVGFMKRFAPSYMKVKELIQNQELGKAASFFMNFCVDGTAFCKDEEEFIKLAAIHVVDLMGYFFGEIAEVSTINYSDGSSVNMCVTLKTKNGVVGSLNLCNMTAWSRESENLTVTFEHGFVQVSEINTVAIHRTKIDQSRSYASQTEMDTVYTPSMTPMSGGLRDLYLRGFVGEMKHFVDWISGEVGPISDSQSNVYTMALCDRILNR